MPSVVHSSNRIVIAGGGIAGLSIARRLAEAGHAVTVLERSRLGSGASTRNQGWLHSGAVFAAGHPGIARLCYESLQQTLRLCPDCAEPGHNGAAFLLSDEGLDPGHWLHAWGEVGIPYAPIPSKELLGHAPALTPSVTRHAFLLPDRSIRVDVLLRSLAAAAARGGVEVRPGTEIVRLLRFHEKVHGVVTSLGEEITARLVILAANTHSGTLLPELARDRDDGSSCRLVPLKTHLVALDPGPSTWPFCLPDRDGFNHLPHPPASVFGTNRWLQADDPNDERPVENEVEHLRERLAKLFPDCGAVCCEAAVWAGTTMQAVPPGRKLPSAVSWPAVIDHAGEPESIDGIISVFPGRATLWPMLAEEALRVVSVKLGLSSPDVASPPWKVTAGCPSAASASARELVDVYHCQRCGRLVRREPGLLPPVCCNAAMTRAAEEVFQDSVTK